MNIDFIRTSQVNNQLYSYKEYILEVTIPQELRIARHVLLSECSALNSNVWKVEFRYANNRLQGGDETITVTTPDETIARLAEADLVFWLNHRAGHLAKDEDFEHEEWDGKSTLQLT